jgi:hypothetical protein
LKTVDVALIKNIVANFFKAKKQCQIILVNWDFKINEPIKHKNNCQNKIQNVKRKVE